MSEKNYNTKTRALAPFTRERNVNKAVEMAHAEDGDRQTAVILRSLGRIAATEASKFGSMDPREVKYDFNIADADSSNSPEEWVPKPNSYHKKYYDRMERGFIKEARSIDKIARRKGRLAGKLYDRTEHGR
jgi:hypothetical protein